MFKYMVVCRSGDKNVYFPSNSRDLSKHIHEHDAKYGWIYDKNGWLISRAELNASTGKVVALALNLDGEPRTRFVDMLNKFNELRKLGVEIAPIVSDFTSGAALSLDERIALADEVRHTSPVFINKRTETQER